jgi:hypothetical protein
VPINDDDLRALGDLRAQAEQRAAEDHVTVTHECFIVTDYLHGRCCADHNCLPTLRSISQRYAKLTKKLGINTRFHDLYRATFLLNHGVTHATVAPILGNTEKTLVDTYSHVVPGEVRAAAQIRSTFVKPLG